MEGKIKMVVNILSLDNGPISREIGEDEYLIRRRAAEFGVPVITNLELADALAEALAGLGNGRFNKRGGTFLESCLTGSSLR